tara:strand:+ start:24294 stop:24944 length:651 start_codon:yes stop_codon:yes gene_type:complete
MKTILPSTLALPSYNTQKYVDELYNSGIRLIHLDLMEKPFVSADWNGEHAMLLALAKYTDLKLDVHLMTNNPSDFYFQHPESIDCINVHLKHVHENKSLLQKMRRKFGKVGIVINPDEELDSINSFISEIDSVILMSVEPGKGGQTFLSKSFKRIAELRALLNTMSPHRDICITVDGGVNDMNIDRIFENGANKVVIGSFLFSEMTPSTTLRKLLS